MSESVIILGGGAPHMALCRNIRKRGMRTVLMDYLENPPARDHADVHIRETCLDAQIVANTARSYDARAILTTHSDRTLPVAAKASESLGLHCYIDHETAVSITSKNVMKRIFRESGIPSSDWQIVTADQPGLKKRLSYPVVCKYANGTGSNGLFIARHERAVEKWIASNIIHAGATGLVVEEFREGPEYSVDAVVIGGVGRILATRERKKVFFPDRGFVLCYGAILDRPFLAQHEARLQHIAQMVADGFGLRNSPLMMQVIFSPEAGFSVIEVAARLSGGLTSSYLPKATGIDLLDFSVSSQLNEAPQPFQKPDDKTYGLQIIYAHPGSIGSISGFQDALHQGLIFDFHLLRQPGDVMPMELTTKSRVAEIVTSADDAMQVAEKIRQALAGIQILSNKNSGIMVTIPEFIMPNNTLLPSQSRKENNTLS